MLDWSNTVYFPAVRHYNGGMTEKKTKHHYIPDNSYLMNFADATGKVWVLKPNGTIFGTDPTNIFKEEHFYTITLGTKGGSLIIENTLAEIEGEFATIYREKIAKGIEMTDQERATVSVFLAALYQRTKAYREGMRGAFEQLRAQIETWRVMFEKNKAARDFSASLERGNGDKDNTFTPADVEHVLENLDEYHSVAIMDALPEIAQIIFNMKWCIMTAPAGHVFVTSDNPFQVLRPESIKNYGPNAIGSRPGLVYEDTEVTAPLSSTHAILAGWKLEQNGTMETDAKMLDQINYQTIMHANDIVANNREILQGILKKNPPVSEDKRSAE